MAEVPGAAREVRMRGAPSLEPRGRWPLFSGDRYVGGFWLRVKGWGVNLRLRSRHRVYFSERYGHVRWYYLGPFCGRFLRP